MNLYLSIYILYEFAQTRLPVTLENQNDIKEIQTDRKEYQ